MKYYTNKIIQASENVNGQHFIIQHNNRDWIISANEEISILRKMGNLVHVILLSHSVPFITHKNNIFAR